MDAQLNSKMRIVTGILKPTPVVWLPVLSNITPPDLRRKEATDKLVGKILAHDEWPVYRDVTEPPCQRLKSRKPLWTDLIPVNIKRKMERTLDGSFNRQQILSG